ncbi:MAG: hypothetical protein A3B92_01315 [Candidatus Harrisonbacteria bacterium RIFCSPHIGHO2_02_FULL_42_16]|uniref:Uncharacterized protein n=1 Tax=Candidatus Harrisonbacteria bacterium RIFCSPHIGHO2_02_FULL_42_16 TaxID=1798404 RepID=A0A1G1ZHV0_9BACT|nr:MAG: hypothetical protein A3B92_01315 [Candidatus Harrisonbacteria bacterium RIFCSPHIGHO2_02_FULL_42_16]
MKLLDSDRKKITNFMDLVGRIRARPFMAEFEKNNLFNIIYPRSNVQKPDEELLRSFILDVRKLYMESEPTSFKKMFPVFMQYVMPDEKIELQKCQNDYEENLTISFPAGIPVKESKTIKNILDDWFYGHYLHEDEKKKNTLSNLGGAEDFYKWIFVDNLGGFVFEFSFSLENLSKKLLYRDQNHKEVIPTVL